MRNYVEAKAGEFNEKLLYQQSVLANLSAAGVHPVLVQRLSELCREAERLLHRTRRALPLNLPQLFRRLQIDLSLVRAKIELLEEWYLPALLHEGEEERAVGRLIDRVLTQLHAPQLPDKIVSFSRALSVFPGVPEHPIFFMPRYTRLCLVDWTGLYHEIGHLVYNQFPVFQSELSNAVLLYCQNQLAQVPALSTSQLNKRAERFRQTLRYWNPLRLAELFCDIFATIVAGPAHLLSWVDISITSPRNPYHVDLVDEHPPNAARTHACMLALDDGYANSPLKRAICDLWETFLNRRSRPALFNQMCPFPLVVSLVQTARAEIARHGFPVFCGSLPLPPESLVYESIDDLQQLVNVGAVNLMFAPAEYPAWQQKIAVKVFGP
jgi:hypothetical protein